MRILPTGKNIKFPVSGYAFYVFTKYSIRKMGYKHKFFILTYLYYKGVCDIIKVVY